MNLTRTDTSVLRAVRTACEAYTAERGHLPTRDQLLSLRASWYSPIAYRWIIRLCVTCILVGLTLVALGLGSVYGIPVYFGASMLASTYTLSRQTVSQVLDAASPDTREIIVHTVLTPMRQSDL